MNVVFPEPMPVKFIFGQRMTDDEFYNLCIANPDLWVERNEQGEIIIVPPAGAESDYRCGDAITQLRSWAMRDGRGKAFGSTAEFILPTGAALSPDTAWVSNVRLSQVSKESLKKFPRLAPEFVIEIKSPGDRLRNAQEKMQMWIRGGVELAWLIDGDAKIVHIYRAGREPEVRTGISKLAGEGPVEGFELDLTDIWTGL